MNKTETALARIFDICDEVAETGEAIRTEDEGRDDARAWLGFENDPAMPTASDGRPQTVTTNFEPLASADGSARNHTKP
jgi:hypothetical protein